MKYWFSFEIFLDVFFLYSSLSKLGVGSPIENNYILRPYILIYFCAPFRFPTKFWRTFTKHFQVSFSWSFSFSSKFLYFINCRICGPTNNHSLIFGSHGLRDFSFRYIQSSSQAVTLAQAARHYVGWVCWLKTSYWVVWLDLVVMPFVWVK